MEFDLADFSKTAIFNPANWSKFVYEAMADFKLPSKITKYPYHDIIVNTIKIMKLVTQK